MTDVLYQGFQNRIDRESGTVDREIFTSPEIYEREQEQIFARSWLFIGHESQIPNPNDFFVSRMGEESVILTRDRQNNIHVLLNTCMHRGMKVCRYDHGNTPVFTCPYHGWSYSTDGNLVSVPGELLGVPGFQTSYAGNLKKEDWGLIYMPHVRNYKGLIFACADKSAPDFDYYLGDFKYYLDDLTSSRDGTDGGSEAIPGIMKWRLPANWKYPVENASDAYHGISHRSEIIVGTGPVGPGSERHALADPTKPRKRESVYFTGRGHHGLGGLPQPDRDWMPHLESPWHPDDDVQFINKYFDEVRQKRRESIGQKPVFDAGVASVFPNMSFHSRFPREIAVWHPVGPMMTEGWHWFLVDKSMPREVKNFLRRYVMRYAGPAGLTEEDDMENWNYATAASKGAIARQHRFNYEQGLGLGSEAEFVENATHTPGISEQNARGFLTRWTECMDAASWSEMWPPA